eukprot:7578202-Pyramimonas_sp.AAC.1
MQRLPPPWRLHDEYPDTFLLVHPSCSHSAAPAANGKRRRRSGERRESPRREGTRRANVSGGKP